MFLRWLFLPFCTASCDSPRFQILHMVYFVQNVQRYRRYKKFEIYVEISTGTTISQEMLKQTVNKNNIHVPVGVSQVSQLVVTTTVKGLNPGVISTTSFLRHVISRDYITREFRVIPKHFLSVFFLMVCKHKSRMWA